MSFFYYIVFKTFLGLKIVYLSATINFYLNALKMNNFKFILKLILTKKLSNISYNKLEISMSLNCDESITKKRLRALNFIKKLDKRTPHIISEVKYLTVVNSLLARKANELFICGIVRYDKKWVDYDTSHRSKQ